MTVTIKSGISPEEAMARVKQGGDVSATIIRRYFVQDRLAAMIPPDVDEPEARKSLARMGYRVTEYRKADQRGWGAAYVEPMSEDAN